jgi:DnaJ domain
VLPKTIMDPYQTLGLPNNCTREDLKEAFRAKARLVHPDRGGDPATFIQLRQAYDQIIIELGRRPSGLIAGTSARPARPDPRPKQPDPNWEPDLILFDEEVDRPRPPGSRDPNWEPDLILLDEEPRHGRFPQPRDPQVARENYLGWLARLSTRPQHEDLITDEKWLNFSSAAVVFFVIILTIWICWAAWNYEPQPEAADLTTRQRGLDP